MSWEVDFRNDGDMTVSGIFYQVFELFLGVKSAVTYGVERHGLADKRTRAPSTDFSEIRVFFYLDSPALVVGKVEVEAVEVMQRHRVDVNLHRVDGEEVTAHVEMHPAVSKTGPIVDNASRKCRFRAF